MNDILKKRWILCPLEDEWLGELKDSPNLLCDGEICLMKAMLLAGADSLTNAANGEEETKIARAANHVYKKIKAVVDTFLGEEDGSEKVPPVEGEVGEAPIEDGQIAGGIESANEPTPN